MISYSITSTSITVDMMALDCFPSGSFLCTYFDSLGIEARGGNKKDMEALKKDEWVKG